MKKVMKWCATVVAITALLCGIIFVCGMTFTKELKETYEAEVLKQETFVLMDYDDDNITMSVMFGMPDSKRIIIREYRANGNTLTREYKNGKMVKVLYRPYGWLELDITGFYEAETEVPE